jgi:hypothetical protein
MSTSSSENEQARTVTLDENDRHQLLSSNRRRAALEELAVRSAPVELDELAATIAERETDGRAVDEARVECVAISLHHNHLPKMNDLGLVDYDTATNRVTERRYRVDTLLE